MHPRRPRGITLLVAAMLAPLLFSGDPQTTTPSTLKTLSLEQLSQIEVVSPSKEPTPIQRTPVAIYVITNDMIRRSGATTIPDVLRLAPGVEVAQIDANKWSVGIRGFGTRLSRDVLVLIDGREVYTPLLAGTYWEVQDYLLEDIDRIEVIRGPGGTIWGPNAVNGVINIITKSSKNTQGEYASAGGGNQEQGFVNYRYGGQSDDLSYRAYFKGFTRGPEYHYDHDNFDDWRGMQGGFRLDWGSGEDAFSLSGDAYKQVDGERVNLSSYSPPGNATLDGNAQLSGGNVLFRWKRTMSDGNDIQVNVFWDRTDRNEVNFGEDRDTFDVDYVQRRKISNRQELVFGAGARASEGRFDEVGSGLVFYPYHRLDYLLSAFVEDDISLVPNKLLLTAGTKLLRTNYTTGVTFEPSARLMWTPTAKQTFWAAYTHALRTPSDAEEAFYLSSLIGAQGGLPFFARFGPNPKFAPEQLNGYEAGYRQLVAKNVFIDVATFYNHYHDLFSEDISGPIFLETTLPFPGAAPPHYLLPADFGNDLFGTTKGFEIAPEWQASDFWRLRGSYSYLDMNLKTNKNLQIGESPELVTGASPKHQISLDSAFDISPRLQLDLIYRYVSALPAVKADAYSTADVRLAWSITPHFDFSVTGRNLFQPHHVEYAADPGASVAIVRSAYATLAWRSK